MLYFSECGGVYFNENGSILSPDYPASCTPSTTCTWIIHAGRGEVVVLEVHDFRIRSTFEDCLDTLKFGISIYMYTYLSVCSIAYTLRPFRVAKCLCCCSRRGQLLII